MGFHTANHEPIYAFHIGGSFYFKQYFDETEIFGRLRQYYNSHEYHFEVDEEKFEIIYGFLEEHGYELVPVDNLEPFVVLVKKYTEHPDEIFKESVLHKSRGDYNFFLMKDRAVAEKAAESGAVNLVDVGLDHPFTAEEL